jgi:hypothetical protein
MLTRTSAPDCLRSGIHMNSVDTGWITDEDPAEHALRTERDGFQPRSTSSTARRACATRSSAGS